MNNLREELRARQQFDAWWAKQTDGFRMYWGSSRVAWAAWVAAQRHMKVETNLPEQLLHTLRRLIPRIEQLRTNADEILEEFQTLLGSGRGSDQRIVKPDTIDTKPDSCNLKSL